MSAAVSRQIDQARGTVTPPMAQKTISVKVPEDLAAWIEAYRAKREAEMRAQVPAALALRITYTTSEAVRDLIDIARSSQPASPKPRKR